MPRLYNGARLKNPILFKSHSYSIYFSFQMCLIAIMVAAEEVQNSTEFDKNPQKRGTYGAVHGSGPQSADSGQGKLNLGSGAGRTGHGEILNVPGFGLGGIKLSPSDIGHEISGLSFAGYGQGGIILITAGNSGHEGLGFAFGTHTGNGGHGIDEIISSPATTTGGHNGLGMLSGGYGLGSGSYGYGGFGSGAGYGGTARGQVQVNTITQQVPVPVHLPVPVTVNRPVPVPVPAPYSVPVLRPVPVHIPQAIPITVVRPYPVTVTRPVAVPVAHPVPVPVAQPYAVPVPQGVPVQVLQPVAVPVPQTINAEVPEPIFLSSGNTGGFRTGGNFPAGSGSGEGHSSGPGVNHIASNIHGSVSSAARHSSGVSLGSVGTFTEHVLRNGGNGMGHGTNFGSENSIIGHSSGSARSGTRQSSAFRSGTLIIGHSSGGGENIGHGSSYISSSGNSELGQASGFGSGSSSINLGHGSGYTATSTTNLVTGHGGPPSDGSSGVGHISAPLQNSRHSATVEPSGAYKN